MSAAEHREPYEPRGSRTDLGARGGEIPLRDSPWLSAGAPTEFGFRRISAEAHTRQPAPEMKIATVSGAGKMIFVAGQLARDARGNCVGKGDMRAQIQQVGENIKTCLEAAGATLADIAKTNTFVHRLRGVRQAPRHADAVFRPGDANLYDGPGQPPGRSRREDRDRGDRSYRQLDGG
jgi:enamine deaminase RidA (YjgF/YER057c/UK114 family)